MPGVADSLSPKQVRAVQGKQSDAGAETARLNAATATRDNDWQQAEALASSMTMRRSCVSRRLRMAEAADSAKGRV